MMKAVLAQHPFRPESAPFQHLLCGDVVHIGVRLQPHQREIFKQIVPQQRNARLPTRCPRQFSSSWMPTRTIPSRTKKAVTKPTGCPSSSTISI